MKFSVLLGSALRSLRGNARRTILTMLGIIIGIASVITIISLGNGYKKEVIKQLTAGETNRVSLSFTFFSTDSTSTQQGGFTTKDIAGIQMLPGVYSASIPEPDTTETYSIVALVRGEERNYDLSLIEAAGSPTVAGEALSSVDYDSMQRNVVISADLAVELYGSPDQAVGKGVRLGEWLFYIKGVKAAATGTGDMMATMFSGASSRIEMPRQTYEQYFGMQRANMQLKVYVETGYASQEVANTVQEYLKEKGEMRRLGTYQFFDMGKLLEGIGQVLSGVTTFISAVAGISLFIAGVGVMNMMYISVSERTKEIGIRRSMGATKSSIQLQFLLEGIIITLIGGILGYLIGIGMAAFIALFLPFDSVTDLFSILLSVFISIFIGIVFSVFPAKSAANKDVIEILR